MKMEQLSWVRKQICLLACCLDSMLLISGISSNYMHYDLKLFYLIIVSTYDSFLSVFYVKHTVGYWFDLCCSLSNEISFLNRFALKKEAVSNLGNELTTLLSSLGKKKAWTTSCQAEKSCALVALKEGFGSHLLVFFNYCFKMKKKYTKRRFKSRKIFIVSCGEIKRILTGYLRYVMFLVLYLKY